MKITLLVVALMAAALTSVPRYVAAQPVVVHDQTFLNSNWELFFAGGQNASSALASRSAGTGVTGDARITSISGFSPMQYDVRHYYTAFNWTPATLGTITDVSFELWYKFQGASTFSITRIVARQGGTQYVAPSTYREPQNSSNFWQRYTGNFNATEFSRLSSSGPSTLDFSPSAAPIQFGYELFSNVNLPGSVVVQNSFFDLQFQHTAAAAPEPNTVAMLFSGFCTIALFTWNKRRLGLK